VGKLYPGLSLKAPPHTHWPHTCLLFIFSIIVSSLSIPFSLSLYLSTPFSHSITIYPFLSLISLSLSLPFSRSLYHYLSLSLSHWLSCFQRWKKSCEVISVGWKNLLMVTGSLRLRFCSAPPYLNTTHTQTPFQNDPDFDQLKCEVASHTHR